MGRIDVTAENASYADIIGCFLLSVLFLIFIVIICVGVWDDLIDAHPITDRVEQVELRLKYPGDKVDRFMVKLENADYWVDIGISASKNLVEGECYLLRQGLLSVAYNLFEPAECE